MSVYEKITNNKNLLIGLVVLLLCISTVQSFFLIKLYRSVEHGNSAEELSQEFEKEFKLEDDFLNHSTITPGACLMSSRACRSAWIACSMIHIIVSG
jgi:hypothetical protein